MMKTPLIELIRESVGYCDIDYDCVAHATRNETISETYKDKTAGLLHILFGEYLQFDEEIDRSQAEEIKEESNYKAPNGHCVDDMIYERASQQKDIYWSDLYDSCGAFGWYINELLSEGYGTHKNIQLTDLIQCGQTRFYEGLGFQAWSKFCEIYNGYLSSYSY